MAGEGEHALRRSESPSSPHTRRRHGQPGDERSFQTELDGMRTESERDGKSSKKDTRETDMSTDQIVVHEKSTETGNGMYFLF